MENPFVKKESEYDKSITRVLEDMDMYGPGSDEYDDLIKHLEKLRNWRAEEQTSRRVSPDTLAIVAGNVAIALIIVAFEQKHVVTTKLHGFLHRGKTQI